MHGPGLVPATVVGSVGPVGPSCRQWPGPRHGAASSAMAWVQDMQSVLELLRVQAREDIPEGVVGRYPVGQFHEPMKPFYLALADRVRHRHPGFSRQKGIVAQHGHGDDVPSVYADPQCAPPAYSSSPATSCSSLDTLKCVFAMIHSGAGHAHQWIMPEIAHLPYQNQA